MLHLYFFATGSQIQTTHKGKLSFAGGRLCGGGLEKYLPLCGFPLTMLAWCLHASVHAVFPTVGPIFKI